MKVRIDYTTREVVVLEAGTVFQHSHNIDYIQIAIDQYTPGLVYKLNFTDPSGNKNLSRYLDYIGASNDLHYFKLPLNSTNTAYEGDLAMSMAIFTQTIEGDVTTTTKIWNSETFYQYIDASEEDETVDIEAEETTIIDEIYAAIALKLNIAHKGYYKASDFSLSGTMTTDAYVTAVYNALSDTEGNYILDTIAHILNDSVTLSDLPSGASDVLLILQFEDEAGTAAKRAQLIARGSVTSDYLYYAFVNSDSEDGFTGWKRYLNDTDLAGITDGSTIVGSATNDKDGNAIDTTYLKKSGGTMSGAIAMGSNKITGLANGTENNDAVNKAQMEAKITADIATHNVSEDAHAALFAAKANLEGGNAFEGNQAINGTINAEGIVAVNATISSQLNKNNTKIVNLGNGSDSKDAVNKGQLDLKENLSNKVNEVVVSGTTDQYVNAAALYAKFLTKVDKAFTIAGLDMQSGSITLSALKTAIGEATTSANGLLSASDKTLIDVLRASYSDDDGNSLVDTIKEVLAAFDGFPETTDLMAYFATKVDKEEGKTLTENDLTDELKTQYDDAVVHANTTNGTNPHLVEYDNLVDKPTTYAEFGLANGSAETIELTTHVKTSKVVFGATAYMEYDNVNKVLKVVITE